MHISDSWRHLRPFKRHGMVLMVAGLVFIAIGAFYIGTDPTDARLQALEYAVKWMPIWAWGVVYIIAGILAIVSSRWPPWSEKWGYSVLSGLSAAWGAFYAVGIIFGDSPVSNVSGTLSWGLLSFMWWAISGLVNPEEH